MSKQDRTYTRTAAELEQKHGFGKRFSEMLGIIDDTRDKVDSVESSLSGVKGNVATIKRSVDVEKARIDLLVEAIADDSAALAEYKQEVSDTYATQKMLTKYQSDTSKALANITQTADKDRSAIEMLVEYDSEGNPTASGSFIIEAINGESSAKIKADRLDIDGKQLNIKVDAANITGTFTVKDADGNAILNAGNNKVTLSGWDFLSKSVRYNNLVFGKENSYVLYPAGSSSSYTIAGTNRSGWRLGIGQNFGVAGDGHLYCKNADITGKITATSGSFTGTVNADRGIIGGWTLGVADSSIYDSTALYTASAVDDYYSYIHPQGVYVANGDKSNEADATWYQIARTANTCFNQASDIQLIMFVDKNNLTHTLKFLHGILVSYTLKEP